MIKENEISIAIIGLGYVGLPLAVEFSKKYPVLGFDLNLKRIEELNTGYDRTKEINSKELKNSQNLLLSTENSSLKNANIYHQKKKVLYLAIAQQTTLTNFSYIQYQTPF